MGVEDVRRYLKDLRQEHLAEGLDALSSEELRLFFDGLQKAGKEILQREQSLLKKPEAKSLSMEPLKEFSEAGDKDYEQKGLQLISSGKAGCLILAGGQATRLGIDHPKGTFAVSLMKKKSLFQLFAEKTKAASHRAGRPLPLAIMTSPLNHEETIAFFKKNDWFGLEEGQVEIFSQEMLPFIDDSGRWLLEKPGKLAMGPDGNGNSLLCFFKQGIGKKWRENGVELLNIVIIDNALADPFDAELFGYHAEKGADITVKATFRMHEEEKVGVLGNANGKLKVIEYSELSDVEKLARENDGSLRWKIASISLFCFQMAFIEKLFEEKASLPWHAARKETNVYSHGKWHKLTMNKIETFIFDWLSFARRAEVLVYPRELCYAPLKNRKGEASLETVQKALLAYDRETYFKITGKVPPEKSFELDPAFYYPTPELLAKWKGKPLPPKDYIEPDL